MNRGMWNLGLASLVILALLYGGAVKGAEVPKGGPTPQVEEEAVPEKPLEKPPEVPIAFPELAPARPYTTFDVGPITGMLAPYGNPWAMDALARGWVSHRLGPLRVSPFLEYDGVYRSNIFQTSTDKLSDFVNVVNPGMRFELPLAQRHKLSVGYLGSYYLYSEHSSESHLDHNVNADATFNFPGGLGLRFGSAYRNATEERTAQTARQRPYDRTTPYLQAAYKLSDRTKLEGIYEFDNMDFTHRVDSVDDYQEHLWGTALYYKFWPKTAAMVQYLITHREYPSFTAGNNTAHTPLVGLIWDPTAKLSGIVKFGYTFKNYENDLAGRKSSPTSWALSIQTIYRYSRYTNITLIAQRSIQEDLDFANSPYINTGLFVTLNHLWHYLKLNSYITLYYVNNAYQTDNFIGPTGALTSRVDNIFSAGCGINRAVTKWLRLRLDYVYITKDSDVPGFGFNEHKVLFGAQTSF